MPVSDDTLAKLLYIAGGPDLLCRALATRPATLEALVDTIERMRGA